MEMVDNAVNFDWTTAGLIMGQQLQYSPPWVADALQPSPPVKQPELVDDAAASSFIIPGWSDHNVVSSRTAWARVRLPEITPRETNILPAASGVDTAAAVNESAEWYNEHVAEDDAVLAVLSEGCQIYLRDLVEKAIHNSRQRQNLDGIRLWYGQCTKKDPPLSLRLGCDVSRQWARTCGNAALVCKRMEEALERQENVPQSARMLGHDALLQEESMSTLAMRPLLANGVQDSDLEAKRCFEIYGGKDAAEVFDRVEKRPRIELIDFQLE